MPALVRDGVRLAYEEAGQGSPPLLLVHGWACDHTYLAPQLAHFSAAQRVVAMDLRGHGASDAPRQAYTMDGFAADLAWLCGQLGLDHPVIIGHSMGGVIALELLRLAPSLPAAVAALDSPMAMPPRTLERMREASAGFTGPLEGPSFHDAVRAYVERMFLATDDPERRRRIVAAMSSRPEYVAGSAFRELLACPSAAAATAGPIPVPLLAVASARGHLADLDRLRDLCPRLTLAQTAGAGHFHQLEVPNQVNAMLDRFLTLLQREP